MNQRIKQNATWLHRKGLALNKHPPSKLGGIAGKGMNETTPPCDSSPQQAGGYSRWNFYKLGKHKEALTQFDKAIKLNPKDNVAWHRKGIELNALKRYNSTQRSKWH